MEKESKAKSLQFYGGWWGVISGFIVMILGIIILTATGQAMPMAFWVPTIAGMGVMLLLAKNRSPCGTGTSAKLALVYTEGKLREGEKYINESFIGSTFTGEIVCVTRAGGDEAVIPKITGSAYITGSATLFLDPDDPFRYGFKV